MSSLRADPWGNGLSANRGRTNGETRGSGVGRVCINQMVVAGPKIAKQISTHIRLFYENFNGINIPWKTRQLNTLHCSLGI